MADFNVATGKEQPLNRTGLDNVRVTGEDTQGTLVGVTTPSGETDSGIYAADADSSVDLDGDGTADGPVKAVGVLLPREIIPEDVAGYVTDHPWADVEEQIYTEDRTLGGDRATFIKYGIEMVNDGTDLGLTPGKAVYLDAGGGFTQDLASLPEGALVQKVGIALDKEQQDGMNEGRERMLLAVEDEVKTVGTATFDGDATNGKTTFNIAHNLDRAPSRYDVTAVSADAAGDFYVDEGATDATNLVVEYVSAPADGTDNVQLHWEAQE